VANFSSTSCVCTSINGGKIRVIIILSYAPGPLLCCLQVNILFGLPHLWHITDISLAHPLFISSTVSVRESGPGEKVDMP